jgi:hypothetical protein
MDIVDLVDVKINGVGVIIPAEKDSGEEEDQMEETKEEF